MKFLKKYFSPAIIITLTINLNCYAGNDAIPVMLRLVTARQDMSRGYNFVEQFEALVYHEISAGRARLWDSPRKEIQLAASSLMDIEKSTGTRFTEQPYIYIYEKWHKATTEIESTTLGFSFLNKNQKGENIAYGYVEYNDISENMLKYILKVNADGNCNQKIDYALQAKQFDFSIVQYNGEVITDEANSDKIKKEYISGLGFNTTFYPLQRQVKCIVYLLERPDNKDDAQSNYTNDILNVIQEYLRDRAVTFSDWGGSMLKDIEKPGDINVTHVEVNETWNKYAGNITYCLNQVVIYINEQPLNSITADELANAEIEFNSTDLTAILKEKKMRFYISRINDQQIERINSFHFLKELKETDWNALNYNVDKRQ